MNTIKKYTIYKDSEIFFTEKEKGKAILEQLNKEQKILFLENNIKNIPTF